MRIDIWSDVMCPWCAVGFGSIAAAIAEYAHPVEIHWHPFELDSSAHDVIEGDYADALSEKYGKTRTHTLQWLDEMRSRGSEVGVHFDFDRLQPGNSFDAHRLLHLARFHGLQTQLQERLLRACFEEGVALGLCENLHSLAVEVGLPSDDVVHVLTSDRYTAEVREELRRASEMGITGVPFFVVDASVVLSGAQPTENLLSALRDAESTCNSNERGPR